jgi:predicted RNA-binding protein with PUA-like domain
MNYWLVKTEPGTFGWDDLNKMGSSMWDGVRNYRARNNLRKMQKGDTLLFYHSGKNPGIAGIAEVIREHYPDPTATKGNWSVVDVKPVRALKRFISLTEVKQIPELSQMVLVRNTRLSVQPVKEEEYDRIMALEKGEGH